MFVAISPYHLTTREAPAMASLLLANRVLTMVPSPFAATSPAAARRVADYTPRYLELMESWQWSVPLWNQGVIVSEIERETATADMREIARRITDDDDLAPLRPLMRDRLFESERDYLNAVGADLLKGGPDPGITVPLAAGLDRFAARHRLIVARSQPSSVAQRAEARLGVQRFAVAIPVYLQGSAELILAAREALDDALDHLRATIDALAHDDPATQGPDLIADLTAAAREYSREFEARQREILSQIDEDDVRPIVGAVAISGVIMPFDAVLRSSLAAVEALGGRRAARSTQPHGTGLPVLAASGDAGTVLSLIVRPLGGVRP